MHETHPTLDYENKNLSSSLSIESYLKRLLYVPHSLSDAWALQCYLDGPLPSKGSGENRGSILGLLIALYEHRSDNSSNATGDSSHGDKGLGGARFLVADRFKWFLRFVHALVQGAHSISQAYHCAHDGNPLSTDVLDAQWTIDGQITSLARGMLEGLQDLWPSSKPSSSNEEDSGMSSKNREASKAAQKRAMEAIRKRQNTFAKSLNIDEKDTSNEKERDLCIICKCDDDDENNGPLGYLSHVQRSRTIQLRAQAENQNNTKSCSKEYRVIGDKGCQVSNFSFLADFLRVRYVLTRKSFQSSKRLKAT